MSKKISELAAEIEPIRPAAPNMVIGIILFIISEAFLFGALFWTYYYLRGHTPVWPPEGVELGLTLPVINTIILISSSIAIWWGERSIKHNQIRGLALGLSLVLLLGTGFLGITIFEWLTESFRPWSHAYGSTFYILTGFHALHVFGGLLLMLSLLIRTLKCRFSSENHLAVQVGSLYWHFVDFVWLVVFTTLFIIT